MMGTQHSVPRHASVHQPRTDYGWGNFPGSQGPHGGPGPRPGGGQERVPMDMRSSASKRVLVMGEAYQRPEGRRRQENGEAPYLPPSVQPQTGWVPEFLNPQHTTPAPLHAQIPQNSQQQAQAFQQVSMAQMMASMMAHVDASIQRAVAHGQHGMKHPCEPSCLPST